MARVDGDLQLVFAPFDPGDIYPLTVKPIGIPEGRKKEGGGVSRSIVGVGRREELTSLPIRLVGPGTHRYTCVGGSRGILSSHAWNR